MRKEYGYPAARENVESLTADRMFKVQQYNLVRHGVGG